MAQILGIESSCDETAAAVVEDGSRILSSVISSQMSTHSRNYGGVVPELASREHLRAIVPAVRLALEQAANAAGRSRRDRGNRRPGPGGIAAGGNHLRQGSGSLARAAADRRESHRRAHPRRGSRSRPHAVEYPALALVVSGGHTHLYEVREAFVYRLLGKTRDDAAGEAFDKVAKLLGFGYPGGPVIDMLAPHGDPHAVRFTLAKMKGNTLDFSFSGLKTAVLRWFEARDMSAEIATRARRSPERHAAPGTVARRHAAGHARRAGFVSTHRDRRTAAPRRALRRRNRRAVPDRLRRRRVQRRLAPRAQRARFAYPVLFPHPGPLHRQRRHDRRRGVSQNSAPGIRGLDLARAGEPCACVSPQSPIPGGESRGRAVAPRDICSPCYHQADGSQHSASRTAESADRRRPEFDRRRIGQRRRRKNHRLGESRDCAVAPRPQGRTARRRCLRPQRASDDGRPRARRTPSASASSRSKNTACASCPWAS